MSSETKPSGTSSISSLPQELIEAILAAVQEEPDIYTHWQITCESASRVCRSFRWPAQALLFRETGVYCPKEPRQLLGLLNRSPHIAELIHSFTISRGSLPGSDGRRWFRPTSAMLSEAHQVQVTLSLILLELPQIRSLSFSGLITCYTIPSGRDWNALAAELKSAVQTTIASPTLRTLRLENFYNVPPSVFSRSCGPLDLFLTPAQQCTDFQESTAKDFVIPAKILHLSICKIKTFIGNTDMSPRSKDINIFLNASRHVLHGLTIEFAQDFHPNNICVDFSRLNSLRCLELHPPTNLGFSGSEFLLIVQTIVPETPLEIIILDEGYLVSQDVRGNLVEHNTDWLRSDEVLSQITSLVSFIFKIHFGAIKQPAPYDGQKYEGGKQFASIIFDLFPRLSRSHRMTVECNKYHSVLGDLRGRWDESRHYDLQLKARILK